MKLAPMRFKGVEWHHNPREITFSCEKEINELHAPYGRSYVQNTGRRNMLIKGEGELFGDDCMEQFERLYALFQEGGSGVLAIPKLGAVYAVFEAAQGETLWDVSYRFDIVIDRLVALNPWVRRPDEDVGGREVALC